MRNTHSRTWNMARELKKVEYEKRTLSVLEFGKKHGKMCKLRKTHFRTWNMARKLKNVEMRHKHCLS